VVLGGNAGSRRLRDGLIRGVEVVDVRTDVGRVGGVPHPPVRLSVNRGVGLRDHCVADGGIRDGGDRHQRIQRLPAAKARVGSDRHP